MKTFIILSLFFAGAAAFAQPKTTNDRHGGRNKIRHKHRGKQVVATCDNAARSAVFRTLDGKCNNLANPGFGASVTPFARFIPAIYSGDGTMPSLARSGKPLPNARLVSSSIHTDVDVPDTIATNAFVMFGQFLDHDITETPFFPNVESRNEAPIPTCCTSSRAAPECNAITPIVHDPFFSKLRTPQTCLPLTRSLDCFESSSCRVNAMARQDTSGFEKREQENAITSFVDSSNIYGFDGNNSMNLRTMEKGLLRSTITASRNELLPILADPTVAVASFDSSACENEDDENEGLGCLFRGGDIRARENPILTVWHTLGLREHNRVAMELAAVNPRMTDEELYQNARKIVIAEFQNVVYAEWLPILLGSAAITKYGLDLDGGNGYKSKVDASIRNSFAAAAFRFGHSMLQGSPVLKDAHGRSTTLKLRDIFDNPTSYSANDGEGAEELLRGMFELPSQTFDRFITEDVTNFLFQTSTTAGFGEDLAARNLQRARDHGVPGYLAFRKFLGLPDHYHWYYGPPSIPRYAWRKLQQVYETPEDIDLFTGGLVETPVQGGLTGPVFNYLIAIQFQKLREGDRFFFTHTDQVGSFNAAQIAAIRKRSLRDIICDNFPMITKARPQTFLLNSALESCGRRTNLDYKLFVAAQSPPENLRSSFNSNTIKVTATFINTRSKSSDAIWINYSGKEALKITISAGGSHAVHTYSTHPWIFRDTINQNLLLDVMDGNGHAKTYFEPKLFGGGSEISVRIIEPIAACMDKLAAWYCYLVGPRGYNYCAHNYTKQNCMKTCKLC